MKRYKSIDFPLPSKSSGEITRYNFFVFFLPSKHEWFDSDLGSGPLPDNICWSEHLTRADQIPSECASRSDAADSIILGSTANLTSETRVRRTRTYDIDDLI